MAPNTAAAAPTDSTYVSIPFLTCAVCRATIEANASDENAGWVDAACDKDLNKQRIPAVAYLLTEELHKLAWWLNYVNETPGVSLSPSENTLKAVATDLYYELTAAKAVIVEMQNTMTAPQKRIAANNLYERGFIGHSGGMARAAERHKVLAAAEAAGIK